MQKGRIMQEGRKNYIESSESERASGELLGYFIAHNIVSVGIFFLITVYLGIYSEREAIFGYSWIQILVYLISSEFWELTIFRIFPLSLISSIMGRIIVYYCIKGYYKYRDRKRKIRRATKRWSELNKGINRMGLRFLITALLTSFIYAVGMISILSYVIFDEKALLPFMVIYFSLKIVTYFFVRWFVGAKT